MEPSVVGKDNMGYTKCVGFSDILNEWPGYTPDNIEEAIVYYPWWRWSKNDKKYKPTKIAFVPPLHPIKIMADYVNPIECPECEYDGKEYILMNWHKVKNFVAVYKKCVYEDLNHL